MDENKKCINLLLEQLKSAHEVLEGTFDGTGEQHAHYQPEGTALSVGASYGHLLFSEDGIITMLMKGQPLFASTMTDKTGFSEPMPGPSDQWATQHAEWAKRVKVDLPKAREYAKAVYSQTEKYLQSLNDEQLNEQIDLSSLGMEKRNLSAVLSEFIIGHTHNLAGEISAIKGVQGLKGYPF